MKHSTRGPGRTLVAGLAALALVAAACGSDDDEGATEDTAAAGGETTEAAAPADGEGKVVTIFSSIRDVEADRLETAWADFEAETGIDIQHEGSGDIRRRPQAARRRRQRPRPRIHPAARSARHARRVTARSCRWSNLKADVEANDIGGWVELRHGRRQVLRPAVRRQHQEPGLVQPGGLRRRRLRDSPAPGRNCSTSARRSSTTAACRGASAPSPVAPPAGCSPTGWRTSCCARPARRPTTSGSPTRSRSTIRRSSTAVDAVGDIVKNDDFVLERRPEHPAAPPSRRPVLPLLDGGCFMHRQANFYGNQFPEGTTKGPDGQVNAFYLPTVNADDPKVMLGGGEVIAAFSDKPEVARPSPSTSPARSTPTTAWPWATG